MDPQSNSSLPSFYMSISKGMYSFDCRRHNPVGRAPYFFLNPVGPTPSQLMLLQANDVWGTLQPFKK